MDVVAIGRTSDASWSTTRRSVRIAEILRWVLWLLVVANLGRIPFLDLGTRQAPILLNDLAVGVVLAGGAIVAMQRRSLRINDVVLVATVFVCIGALSAIAAIPRFGLTTMELVASLAYLLRWVFYFGLYVVVINSVRASDADGLWSALEGALLVIAAFGIVQAIFLPNFAFMVYPDAGDNPEWDAQRHRLVSTVLEPNVAAAMIVVVLLVQLARLAFGAPMPLWKPVLLIAALGMTLSRSGALSFVVGLLIITSIRGLSKRVARLGAVVVALLIVSLPKLISFAAEYQRFGITDGSALARVGTWRRAIAILVEHPWFGIGFNTFGYVQERMGVPRAAAATYSAEGGVLFIAVMTGVVGLAVYLVMLWLALRRCRSGWRDGRATSAERALFVGTASATIAILVHSVFVNSMLVPFVMEALWVLWGLSFVTERSLRERPHPGLISTQLA